jgi:hypothetical protein
MTALSVERQMSQETRRGDVLLEVKAPVELEAGVVLPAGSYNGTSKETGLQTDQGVSWTSPTYHIELTSDQLVALGAKNVDHPVSTEYDLTKYVRSGEIEVL